MNSVLPLEGITVIDLSQLLPGPYATMLLADLGADVVKVERPPDGESGRAFNPALVSGVNRNKRSIAIDLKHTAGQEVLRRMVARADVLVEGFRPGVAERLGLSYPTLRRQNPGLVYCSITGYGQTGPHRDRPGHDVNYAGLAGVLAMACPTGQPPSALTLPVTDLAGAMYAALSVLAAVLARTRTGLGDYLDVSMSESALSWLAPRLAEQALSGLDDDELKRRGSYGVFACRDDRYITIGAAEQHFFRRLCEVVGRPEWLDDARFATWQSRNAHGAELQLDLAAAFRQRDSEEWIALLSAADVPAGPVHAMADVLKDEQYVARGMFDMTVGDVPQVRYPVLFGRAGRPPVRSPSPEVGAHTDEILHAAGYSDSEIENLRADDACQ